MDIQDIGLGLAGILVSIFTFALGYRQTIGARQIRIAASNDSLVDTLLRVIVVEEMDVSAEDVETALSGRASKIGVPVDALMTTSQVADVLHHQILSSDLITKMDRERALTTVVSIRKDLIPSHYKDMTKRLRLVQRTVVFGVVALAIVAAITGVAVVSVFNNKDSGTDLRDLLVQFAIAMALALLSTIALRARYRTSSAQRTLPSSNPSARELLRYPEEEEGVPYLRLLKGLSPFAVRNLFQFGQDELRSVRSNVPAGLSGDPAIHLGLQELLDKRLVEKGEKPKEIRGKHDWYFLTSKGRSVNRLLQPSVEDSGEDVPTYLLPYASTALNAAVNADENSTKFSGVIEDQAASSDARGNGSRSG